MCTDGRTLRHNQIFWDGRFTKFSYPWCSAAELRYYKLKLVAKLQESVTLATNWYDSNLLQGNLKKYQTMNIRNKSVNYGDKTSITVIGQDIMESDNLEVLGVTIDCGLNFNLHISDVCKKASQRVGVIMRLRILIPNEAKLRLFKAANILPLGVAFL